MIEGEALREYNPTKGPPHDGSSATLASLTLKVFFLFDLLSPGGL